MGCVAGTSVILTSIFCLPHVRHVSQIALTSFYGISHETAKRLCARLQLHELATVSSLTEAQVTALSAYLSSPSSIPARAPAPTSPFPSIVRQNNAELSRPPSDEADGLPPPSQRAAPEEDPLRSLVLESDLRRELRANLNHHRTIGSYVGRRHVAGLPVRGQRTRTNAITAGKLNKIERRGMATVAGPSVSEIVQPLLKKRFA